MVIRVVRMRQAKEWVNNDEVGFHAAFKSTNSNLQINMGCMQISFGLRLVFHSPNPAINGNPKLPDVRFSIVPINSSIFPPEMRIKRNVKVVYVESINFLIRFFVYLRHNGIL